MSTMSHELNCILQGTNHLFQGKKDEFEFYAVTPPMDVKKGEGARVLYVKYSFNRTGHRLVRQEAVVESPIPPQPPEGQDVDVERIKKTKKEKFDMATNVRGFEVTYLWIPPEKNVNDTDPPVSIEPVEMDRNEKGWGLPQAVKITLTLDDPNSETKRTTFTTMTVFRGETTTYNEDKLGARGGLS
jgi:hypothetical protein